MVIRAGSPGERSDPPIPPLNGALRPWRSWRASVPRDRTDTVAARAFHPSKRRPPLGARGSAARERRSDASFRRPRARLRAARGGSLRSPSFRGLSPKRLTSARVEMASLEADVTSFRKCPPVRGEEGIEGPAEGLFVPTQGHEARPLGHEPRPLGHEPHSRGSVPRFRFRALVRLSPHPSRLRERRPKMSGRSSFRPVRATWRSIGSRKPVASSLVPTGSSQDIKGTWLVEVGTNDVPMRASLVPLLAKHVPIGGSLVHAGTNDGSSRTKHARVRPKETPRARIVRGAFYERRDLVYVARSLVDVARSLRRVLRSLGLEPRMLRLLLRSVSFCARALEGERDRPASARSGRHREAMGSRRGGSHPPRRQEGPDSPRRSEGDRGRSHPSGPRADDSGVGSVEDAHPVTSAA